MKRDMKTLIKQLLALNIQTIATDTDTAGNEIDTQGFESLTFLLMIGALTDGDYTLKIQHSDVSGSGYVDVPDDFLVGLESETQLDTANTISKIGYVGKKRYVKATVTSANTTSGATVGAVAILGTPRQAPVS